jgi:hypothetical protein
MSNRHDLRYSSVWLVCQLSLASRNRAMVIVSLVAFVAEEHWPADQTNEVFRIITTNTCELDT